MKSILFTSVILFCNLQVYSQLIADHNCTNINSIPEAAIIQAKETLHIAYGHTSHGSQITDGMNGLVEFANNGGRGLSLSHDIFRMNQDGSSGALHLEDGALGGDVGYWPDWYNNTVSYLNNSDNSEINVIMWSWCGQVGDRYEEGVLWQQYLSPMSNLETAYPGVVFVYMTGHLEYGDASTNAANDSIRSFCRRHGKVLFDFADIESYSPGGTCYRETGDDGCNYYNENGSLAGNWAIEYQNSHTEGVDWYDCNSAHSEALNANLKAYAAWWMWASLGGWNYNPQSINIGSRQISANVYPNPASEYSCLEISDLEQEIITVDLFSASGAIIEHDLIFQETENKRIYNISAANLPSGLYYFLLRSEGHTQSYRFSVLR